MDSNKDTLFLTEDDISLLKKAMLGLEKAVSSTIELGKEYLAECGFQDEMSHEALGALRREKANLRHLLSRMANFCPAPKTANPQLSEKIEQLDCNVTENRIRMN